MTLLFIVGLGSRTRPRVFGRLSVISQLLRQINFPNALFLYF